MNEWSKEQLEEMVGDDIIDQMAFVSGCHKHKLMNDKDAPDGWIIPDEVLRKFAKLIVRECAQYAEYQLQVGGYKADMLKRHFGVEE